MAPVSVPTHCRGVKLKKRRRRGPITIQREKTWSVFSELIRRRDADENGFITCPGCRRQCFWKGKKKPGTRRDAWLSAHAGHFLGKKAFPALYFEKKNVIAQCSVCNKNREGMQYRTGLEIDRRFGKGVAEDLHLMAFDPDTGQVYKGNMTEAELAELQKQFQFELDQLKKDKPLPEIAPLWFHL